MLTRLLARNRALSRLVVALFLLVGVNLSASSSHAGYLWSDELLSACKQDASPNSFCAGYIRGAAETAVADNGARRKRHICIPKGLEPFETIPVVIRYITKKNRSFISRYAAQSSVAAALAVNFRCKEGERVREFNLEGQFKRP